MLSLQEMSDRLEIQDLLTAYCHAIDLRDWDALDNVFTADAFIDYTQAGGERGALPQIKAYLDRAMKQFSGFQHMVSTMKLELDGDAAKAKTILFNPMITEHGGSQHVFFVGLWYCDRLVRTAEGWRIRERVEECPWFHNLPQGMRSAK